MWWAMAGGNVTWPCGNTDLRHSNPLFYAIITLINAMLTLSNAILGPDQLDVPTAPGQDPPPPADPDDPEGKSL